MVVRNTGKSVDKVAGAIAFIKGRAACGRLAVAFRTILELRKCQWTKIREEGGDKLSLIVTYCLSVHPRLFAFSADRRL